mgnify:FL=1
MLLYDINYNITYKRVGMSLSHYKRKDYSPIIYLKEDIHMIDIIAGAKGKGKTKILIQQVLY